MVNDLWRFVLVQKFWKSHQILRSNSKTIGPETTNCQNYIKRNEFWHCLKPCWCRWPVILSSVSNFQNKIVLKNCQKFTMNRTSWLLKVPLTKNLFHLVRKCLIFHELGTLTLALLTASNKSKACFPAIKSTPIKSKGCNIKYLAVNVPSVGPSVVASVRRPSDKIPVYLAIRRRTFDCPVGVRTPLNCSGKHPGW